MDQGPWVQELPRKLELTSDGLKIGVLHGDALGARLFGVDLVHQFSPGVGLICYGHTHRRDWRQQGGCFVLNPGSFTLPKGSEPGFAELTYTKGQGLELKWIDLNGPKR